MVVSETGMATIIGGQEPLDRFIRSYLWLFYEFTLLHECIVRATQSLLGYGFLSVSRLWLGHFAHRYLEPLTKSAWTTSDFCHWGIWTSRGLCIIYDSLSQMHDETDAFLLSQWRIHRRINNRKTPTINPPTPDLRYELRKHTNTRFELTYDSA